MMKNLNGRTHNACYHPYYHQSLHFAQQQQQHLQQQQHMQQQLQQAPPQQLRHQQRQLPTQPAYQQSQSVAHNAFPLRSSSNNYGHVASSAYAASSHNSNNAAAMAAVCQMQNFFNQQQQQQEYNNNCMPINYYQQQQQQHYPPESQSSASGWSESPGQAQLALTTTAATCSTTAATCNTTAAATSSTTATSAAAGSDNSNSDNFAMDASEIATFLANELFLQQLGNFETGQSVLTLTTPTLTPTTTRNIEDTLGHLLSDTQTDRVAGCAGFAVPKVLPNAMGAIDALGMGIPTCVSSLPLQQTYDASLGQGSESEDSNASYNDTQMNEEQDTTDTSSAHTDSTSYQAGHIMAGSVNGGGVNNFTNVLAAVSSSRGSASVGSSNANTSNTPARRGGGRRPNRSTNMTPEEEQKRAVRRERNKQAAARCRKRRVDQTNELTEEVEQLEKRRDSMRKEFEALTNSKKQLEYLLATHRSTCQKIRSDMLSVATCNGLIAPAGLLSAGSSGSGASSHHNHNSNDSSNGTITGMDATLNSTGRSNSPLDLKPAANIDSLLLHIKDEPLDGAIDSGSSLDQDGPPPSKRITLPPMSTMPHVHLSTLITPTGASSGSLQTPITSTAPVGFGSAFPVTSNGSSINNINSIGNSMNSPTLNALNKVPKERPNTLAFQRPLGQMHLTMANNKAGGPTQIQGVPIQTPSTGTFNFDSLMDGGTGLTPVSGPLVPNSSSTNKHPLELPTPTAEPSKLVSL
ncbi:transcription factor kayak isoform X1 [Drosophila mauritiana]|uniref:Transcription factor kayak isoform X1 n=1 Tax=Drosophila mauritiana TaxID=7226 RepID=A0A6P8KW27_DROMA|nr:transcription factor kayak isoform X1 [Drosophila mauritiana]